MTPNKSGVRDRTLSRYAAAAVLQIPLDDDRITAWHTLRPLIYDADDEGLLLRFEDVKQALSRQRSYSDILAYVESGEALRAVCGDVTQVKQENSG